MNKDPEQLKREYYEKKNYYMAKYEELKRFDDDPRNVTKKKQQIQEIKLKL